MKEFIFGWIQDIAFYTLLMEVVLHVLPEQGQKKYLQFFMGIVLIILVVSPMLSAAGLSFSGVGVAPPAPEWGAMLNYAQDYFKTAPYMALFPGAAIALTALSINLVGDGLRDALDPKTGK